MIRLLVGKKGSGKTKKLIDAAQKALTETKGNVVVLEKGAKLTYEISHKARLIDTDAYKISGKDALYGFVSGICAGNYDVTNILIDSTLKIIGTEMNDLETLINDLDVLCEQSKTEMVLSISADESELPQSFSKYL